MASHQPHYTVESVAGYVAFIEKNCTDGEWLFRGQPCDKPLLPKIYRPEFWEGEEYDQEKHQIEERIFEEFKSKAVPFLDSVPQNELEWLAIAQHYGLPTRLLDWSASPVAGVWFAVRENLEPESTGVVWACLPTKNDLFLTGGKTARRKSDPKTKPFDMEQKETCFFRPPSIVARITAQHSWFSVHPDRKAGKEGHPVPLERNSRYSGRAKYKKRKKEGKEVGRLLKIEVPRARWTALREQLNRLCFDQSTIYPDLDGLCGHLEWWAKGQNRKSGTARKKKRK